MLQYIRAQVADILAYGLEEAIFLTHFTDRILAQKSEQAGERDGVTWVRSSSKGWARFFDGIWSEDKIDRIIKKLVTLGALNKSNFNSHTSDNTKWLSLADSKSLDARQKPRPEKPANIAYKKRIVPVSPPNPPQNCGTADPLAQLGHDDGVVADRAGSAKLRSMPRKNAERTIRVNRSNSNTVNTFYPPFSQNAPAQTETKEPAPPPPPPPTASSVKKIKVLIRSIFSSNRKYVGYDPHPTTAEVTDAATEIWDIYGEWCVPKLHKIRQYCIENELGRIRDSATLLRILALEKQQE